jgi:homogentisate 1,2-dioxygenase
MPIYHSLGKLPSKRHIVFEREGGGLYYEELIGNKGFVGPSSLLYHVQHPTQVRSVRPLKTLTLEEDCEPTFRHRHFRTAQLPPATSITADRIPLLFNADVALDYVAPTKEDDYFYRNAQGDEVVYVSDGAGVLETQLATTSSSRAASCIAIASAKCRSAVS